MTRPDESDALPPALVARDLGLVGLTALAWWGDLALRARVGALALAVGVAAGVLTAVVGFLAH